MRRTILGLSLVIVSFLGFLDASYITYSELSGVIPPCQPPFDCGRVLESPWSHIGPIPLSLIGMMYYLLVLFVGAIFFVRQNKSAKELLLILTTAGFFFSLYLINVMAFILNAWCLFCLFSALSSMVLFILSVFLQDAHLKRAYIHGLYIWVLKPFFFLFDAETVHIKMTQIGSILGTYGITRFFTTKLFAFENAKLHKTIDGITFPNPVGLSAGFDYDGELTGILPAVGFGFATIGTVTYRPYAGNAKPRLGRYPKSHALLVNKGFKSQGAKAIISKLEHKEFSIPIGISIGSTNAEYSSLSDQIKDIKACFQLFEQSKVKHRYYELNISCPNTMGNRPLTTPDRLNKLLSMIDSLKIQRPIYLKMPIDLGDKKTLQLLETASSHRINGVIFGNLTKDKTNPDVHPTDLLHWQTARGNVSGKPTWNRSNHLIQLTRYTYESRFTIIGTGGIFTSEDAMYKLSIGADLVQLITGMIYEGPQLIGEINEHLAQERE